MARVLIVDDLPDSLLASRAALAGAGHECVLAPGGDWALHHLASGEYDVVVLDPAMPLHDGWPVLTAARSVPVVVMSAAPVHPDGVAAVLPKPCPAADLVEAVAAALAGSRPG